ncbi:hypothetical protein [Myceligenerans indicum]|uniref:Uncharacterized protein n=1 Tax=Myceligenerans indicum TaxID=2593663 RepID=A0ABS1LRK5_9MICO|nr:hypothetical protein [Myceligenerans indicum]MBL0888865.1 hypothetical protein [Myceligenerans indicum]
MSDAVPALDAPAAPPGVTERPEGAPLLSMLADDGAVCVDGVCALPEPGTR